jgi:hypothetical protein
MVVPVGVLEWGLGGGVTGDFILQLAELFAEFFFVHGFVGGCGLRFFCRRGRFVCGSADGGR